MSLDISLLQSKIKDAFKKSKETPPPADPSATDQVQQQILDTLSADLAAAIHSFVTGADVLNVAVDVKDAANNAIGKGFQTGKGILQ